MEPKQKLIAFTFDDFPVYPELGDSPTNTILQELDAFGGKATFFVVGKWLKANGDRLVYEALNRGCELGNHTENHLDLTELSSETIREEILSLQDTVEERFGVRMKYLRPAGLAADDRVLSVIRELNFPVIYGTNSSDWNRAVPAQQVKANCLRHVYPGQIFLMHSYSPGTQGCFHEICETLTAQGYSFVTLSELFDAYGLTELPCGRPISDAQLSPV